MGPRYGVHVAKAWGVSMADLKGCAKRLGRNHELAAALWASGWYEARLLAAMIDEPGKVTLGQMDRWCRDFDNWGLCDTVCFVLFDRVDGAWSRVVPWSRNTGEFQKRGAFALLWALALHDKSAADDQFLAGLECIEAASTDERNFVKKAVNMALRAVGRRGPLVHAAAVKVAGRMAESDNPAARWNGKHALRELASGATIRKFPAARGT